MTTQEFILHALAEKLADEDTRRTDFYDTAERRYDGIIASGRTIPWETMRRCLEDRVSDLTSEKQGSSKYTCTSKLGGSTPRRESGRVYRRQRRTTSALARVIGPHRPVQALSDTKVRMT